MNERTNADALVVGDLGTVRGRLATLLGLAAAEVAMRRLVRGGGGGDEDRFARTRTFVADRLRNLAVAEDAAREYSELLERDVRGDEETSVEESRRRRREIVDIVDEESEFIERYLRLVFEDASKTSSSGMVETTF